MKKMFFLLFLIPSLLSAQELERQVVANLGENSTSGDLTLTWTLGELVVETNGGSSDLSITDGFHQGALTIVNTFDYDQDITLEVYPNPTTSVLTISSAVKKQLTVTLIDPLGRSVANYELNFPILHSIDLSHLAPASYFLKITDDAGQLINITTIQKIK